MKRRLWTSLIGVVLIVLITLGFNIATDNTPILGLDLQGGVSVILAPTESATAEELTVIRDQIRSELERQGIAEPDVRVQGDTIVVDLPGVRDQQEALSAVDVSGVVELRPVLNPASCQPVDTAPAGPVVDTPTPSDESVPNDSTEPQGLRSPQAPTDTTPADTAPTDTSPPVVVNEPLPTQTVTPGAEVLPTRDGAAECVGPAQGTGEVFERGSAEPTLDASQGWGVSVDLRGGEGRDTWNNLANQCFNRAPTCPTQRLAIVLDSVVQSAPTVNEPNFTDAVSISGSFTQSEAEELAAVLNRGAFPVEVEAQEARTVSPSAGSDSLQAAVIAGLVGLALVLVVPRRLLPLACTGHRRRHHGVGRHGVLDGVVRVRMDQLRAQPRRCDRHHRGDRCHRRQLRGVLRTDQGRAAQRTHDQERRASQLQDDVADDLVGRRRVADRRWHLVLAERRLRAWLRPVPRTHDDLRSPRLLLLHAPCHLAAGSEQADGQTGDVARHEGGNGMTLDTSVSTTGLGRLFRGQTAIDFYGKRKVGLIVAVIAVVVTFGSLLTQGLNLGLDFEGGDAWDIPASETFGVDEATDVLQANDVSTTGARIQLRSSETSDVVTVQVEELPREQAEEVTADFAEAAGVTVEDISFSFTSSTWGAEITEKAVRALVIFLFVVAVFISVRFEWRMALAAIAAMLNDVIVAVGVYSVFQFEVTPATVIAFLTILGYSLYDTIVVFDRVKENEGRYASTKMPYEDIVNISMNQVMVRSLLTSFSSILPVISLLLLGAGLLGAVSLREFALALLIGMISGVYSSIFIATPLLAFLKSKTTKASRRQRLLGEDLRFAVMGAGVSGRIPQDTPHSDGDTSAETPSDREPVTAGAPTGATAPTQADRLLTHPPRPRKKKKR